MSLIIAGASLAASWGTQTQLSGSYAAEAVDVATMSSTAAVAVYADTATADTIFSRRTIDGGVTWYPPVTVATGASFLAISAVGTSVDVVYNKTSDGRAWYRRSTDGGVTYFPAMAISPAGRYAWRPDVARGPGGIVAVGYVDAGNGNVGVRVSTDGGVTFAAADILSGSGDDQTIAVAVGTGVIYAAYSVGSVSLRVKRTLNNGTTWSSARVITNGLWDSPIGLTAAVDHAYIAYATSNTSPNFSRVRYKRTLDSGATWSGQMNLGPASWSTQQPDLALAGGILRASFTRCTPQFDVCEPNRVFYRQSSNGNTWTTPERVSTSALYDAADSSVGAQHAIVVYVGDTGTNEVVFARAKN